MKNKFSRESTFSPTAPIRSSEISADVELMPPTSNGAEVQEKVTKETIVDIQRYLRWAEKALQPKERRDRRSHDSQRAA